MDSDVEEATDTLGSGGILETGLYSIKLKAAYLGKSDKGATSVTIVGEMQNGSSYKSTQWIVSGDEKGNKPFYVNNQGKKFPLPGYTIIDDICQIVAGVPLSDIEMEEKTLKIYDYELKKEVNTEVDCICDLDGQTVVLAIQKIIENKSEKDEEGNYQPTRETRDINDISKVLNDEGATRIELRDEEAVEWSEAWETKNKGKTRDKTSKEVGTEGAPAKKSAKKKMFS